MRVPSALILVLGCLALTCFCQGQGSPAVTPTGTESQTLAIDRLFKGYDKRIRPTGQNGMLNVSVNILVLDVFDVDETKHEFKVTMFLRQHWIDERLQYTSVPGMNQIVLDADHMTQLWTPDTFILNERSAVRHDFGTVQQFTKIMPSGRVLQSSRVTVAASCKMSLGYFPFDRQLCTLELASYAQSTSNYLLKWAAIGDSHGAAISEDLSSASLNYRFTGIQTSTKTLIYPYGTQTRLGLEFFFARHSVRFVQDVFFPTFVISVAAFLTLYCSSMVLRLQLSVALMLGMMLFTSFTSSWMPRVSYQTALDLYMSFSAFMVFLSMIVNFIQYNFQIICGNGRQPGLPLQDMNSMEKCDQLVDYDKSNPMNEPLCQSETIRGVRFGSKVDEILKKSCVMSRLYLPLTYVAFNVIFWLVVLIGSCWYPSTVFVNEGQV